MLKIRNQQMDQMRDATRRNFHIDMVRHSKEFSPKLCQTLGDEQVDVVVQSALQRADQYEFTKRGPLRLFVEMTFLFGSGFDSDPQYSWAREILESDDEQMRRAQMLFDKIMDYQSFVAGPKRTNTHKALKKLAAIAEKPLPVDESNFNGSLLAELKAAFPEKCTYVTDDGMNALIEEGKSAAASFQLPSPRGSALMVVLMFAFGHSCAEDPLYPWIGRTLMDGEIKDPPARVKRLEKKSITWLKHVLEGSTSGGASD